MVYPSKPAPIAHSILPPIVERWSPYAFSDQPIEEEKIRRLFEAARWAPSSFNEQPWRYCYALKGSGSKREAIESLLSVGNSWAKQAGMLIVTFAKKTFAHNGKPNRHAFHDLGCASGYLVLQLPSLGLVGHQMAGFDVARANAVAGLDADFEPGSMIAVGYPGEASALPEELRKREQAPRTRKDQAEFVLR